MNLSLPRMDKLFCFDYERECSLFIFDCGKIQGYRIGCLSLVFICASVRKDIERELSRYAKVMRLLKRFVFFFLKRLERRTLSYRRHG